MLRLNFLFLLLFTLSSFTLSAQNDELVDKALEQVDFNYFIKHVEFLADDLLQGRGTATEGYAVAADYVAKGFKQNDLLPMGDAGSYFQNVPFVEGRLEKSEFSFVIGNETKKASALYGENLTVLINPQKKGLSENLDLVFVGYGNVIPNLEINDYRGQDVKDKIVFVALGGPKKIKHHSFNDPFAKLLNAKQNGAAGIILYTTKGLIEGLMFKEIHGFMDSPQLAVADTSVSKPFIDMDIVAFAKHKYIKEALITNNYRFKDLHKAMKKGSYVSFSMVNKLSCNLPVVQEKKSCKNVVGLLPGTHRRMRNEYIVVGAHLDHLGIGEAVKGDSIYNGMWDNATGVAALLSMSKAVKESGLKTKRSILFVAYTGEEKGLLGSDYYAQKSNIPKGKIVANINIDMLGGMFDTKQIIPIGYSHSNLKEAVDYSIDKLGMEALVDERTERSYIERSDQLSFIKIGAPAIYFSTSANAINKTNEIGKDVEKWIKKVYHTPFDDNNQEYSAASFQSNIKLNLLTTYYAASQLNEVVWDKESWIYKKYKLDKKKKTSIVEDLEDY